MATSSFPSFNEYLTETYKNLVKADPAKEQYKEVVFGILQKSYAPIGGIHGSGFRSPDDMVANIPFWKLVVKAGRVVAVAMYKDSGGRKRVAIGTDGSEEGKTAIRKLVLEEYDRAYFEISDRSLSMQAKVLGYDFITKYAKTPAQAAAILGEPVEPVPGDDPDLARHPQLAKFFYQRKLGGQMHTKVMLGTNGKKIVDR